MASRVSDKELDEMIERYKDGESQEYIADKIGRASGTISRLLNKSNKVEVRSLSEANTTCTLDHNVFENINSEETTYWIGFLMGDGSINDKSAGNDDIILQLGGIDENHLKDYRNFLGSNHSIYREEKEDLQDGLRVTVTSKKIVEDLAKYGIKPRKAKTATTCDKLKNNRHYWRGLIDADGCLSFYENETGERLELFLTGSQTNCGMFKEWCSQFIDSEANINQKPSGAYIYRATNDRAKIIAKKLYQDAEVYLDRKMERYKQYFIT